MPLERNLSVSTSHKRTQVSTFSPRYENPASYSTTANKGQAEPKLGFRPERGMALIHFPCTAPHAGGFVDFNTTHLGEEAVDEKYIVQQFIYADR